MKTSTLFTAALMALGTFSAASTAMARERGEAPRHEDRRSTVGDDRGGRADRNSRTETGDDRGTARDDDRGGRGAEDRRGR